MRMAFEKSTSYFENPDVPARILETKPKMKVAVVLCNPLHRVVSHVLHGFGPKYEWPNYNHMFFL